MSELNRRLDERRITVSKGHLWAAGVAAVLVFACGALVGYRVGVAVEPPPPLARIVDGPSDGALVDVLARVDATSDPQGARRLSFPDALKSSEAPVGPAVLPDPVEPLQAAALAVEAGTGVSTSGLDPRPEGRFTVELGRFDTPEAAVVLRDAAVLAGASAVWIGVERVGGAVAFVVASGGYPTAQDAEGAAAGLPADVGTPLVSELR